MAGAGAVPGLDPGIEIILDPHVSTAILCLVLALCALFLVLLLNGASARRK